MDKQVQKIKDQFSELAEAVNAFNYEAVQIKVVDWLLQVIDAEQSGAKKKHSNPKERQPSEVNKPGATKILNQLLLTEFFDTPHSIAEIVSYGNEQFDTTIEPSQFSGVLIHLVKTHRLKRKRTENDRSFRYSKP